MTKTITDAFEPYIGTVEYNGIVKTIQEWFYGDLVKASWCATSCSYFADQVGVLDQLGGKNENVYYMLQAAKKAYEKTEKGKLYTKENLKSGLHLPKGTVIFMLHSGKVMTATSSKHVTTLYSEIEYNKSGSFKGLGGNQRDSICVATYPQSEIYAAFVPDYGAEPAPEPTPGPGKHTTLRRGSKGAEVKELQTFLNCWGYRNQYGNSLAVDGSYGSRTEAAVKNLQHDQGLEADGICGPITWARIDELRGQIYGVKPITEVYCRKDPRKTSDIVGVLYPDDVYTATREKDGWAMIADKSGWSKSEYLKAIK